MQAFICLRAIITTLNHLNGRDGELRDGCHVGSQAMNPKDNFQLTYDNNSILRLQDKRELQKKEFSKEFFNKYYEINRDSD